MISELQLYSYFKKALVGLVSLREDIETALRIDSIPQYRTGLLKLGMNMLHSPGDIIAERYRIVSPLGQINTSNTYVAEDFANNKLVAIKAISLRQMNDWKDIELLERQAKVLAHLDLLSKLIWLESSISSIDSVLIVFLLHCWCASGRRLSDAGCYQTSSLRKYYPQISNPSPIASSILIKSEIPGSSMLPYLNIILLPCLGLGFLISFMS